MNITIAGKNNIAIDVLENIVSRYPKANVFAVFNKNDSCVDGFQRSFKKYCKDKKIESVSLEEAYSLPNNIFISLEFDRIVNPELFENTKIYNVHFSKLPSYKGMYTSAWPILNNEVESGVTFHYIDRGIDTGDIIYQRNFLLDIDETAKSLYEKYIQHGTSLVIDNLYDILETDPEGIRQENSSSSYYSKSSIDYRNIEIDLRKTAIEVKKQIDAFTFRDYQLPKIDGIEIFGCEILQNKSEKAAGSIFDSKSSLIISTIDYDIIAYKDSFDALLNYCKVGSIDGVLNTVNRFNTNEKDVNGWSPIIVAAYHGHINIVEYLVSVGADINDRNYKGTTVFMYAKNFAESSGCYDILDRLISLGADPKLKDLKGLDVFDYIRLSNNNKLIEKLGHYL
ncbi:formyl transferase [Vibrio coralliilyticus]|nr:formyl transferase [Vibrio coralliilyticus]